MSNNSNVTIINKGDTKILNKGVHNIKSTPDKLLISSKTRVQLSSMPDMQGYNLIIDNTNDKDKEINVVNLIKSGSIDSIKSIYVMTNMCKMDKCGGMVEGFSNRDISDTCHYVCSSLNLQNALICIIFIILIFYLLSTYFQ